ncbi:hypothetical protein [Aurantimonas coralicida]|uniref:hypothetical protein n=1 Tax=Aurantimonas coralicida TaxID=182270 RepID=UPI000462E2B3|nr:hypothetical protein [Aurantimonas coralicida]
MHYDLISEDDYATLPDDPELKFVAVEAVCRRNMNRLIDQDTQVEFDHLVRAQYMTIVAAAAEELGIARVEFPDYADEPATEFNRFLRATSAAVARIRLKSGGRNDPLSVRLATVTRGKIEREIQRLRNMIDESDLPKARKAALQGKLDDLSSELRNQRVGFGKTLAILAHVGALMVGTVAVFADAPDAIATITKLLGDDKIAEDAEAQRLGAPPVQQALPAPAKRQELDDEIPF